MANLNSKKMKKIIQIFVLFFCISILNAQISKAEIIATGLTCSMCSNAINKQLKKLPEVEKVDINLNSNTFTVYLNKSNSITPKTLKESIEKAGFFVGSMLITMDFENQKIVDNFTLKKGNLNLIFIDTDSKILNGTTQFKILDKGYLVLKDFKKFTKIYSKYPTYLIDNEDDYHLKLL